jgi:hypothetical protein
MRIRTRDAKMVLGLTSNSALAALLPPNPRTGRPYHKTQVGRWGDLLPELQSRQLVEQFPELRDYVLDQVTGMSIADMRAAVVAAAEDDRGR